MEEEVNKKELEDNSIKESSTDTINSGANKIIEKKEEITKGNNGQKLESKENPPQLDFSEAKKIVEDVERVKKELNELKKDFLIIFGIFASFVTFLSVEIQIFKIITDFRLLLGLSSFLIAGILLFAFALNNIAKDKDEWRSFLNPVFILICIFLIISVFFFSIYTYK